jgi:MFS family permease
MRRLIGSMLAVGMLGGVLAACAAQPYGPVTTPRTYQGAGAGAAVGAGAGALIDKDNRWRGAVLGAALGGLLGGTLTEISSRAAREAAAEGQPVVYQSSDGWQRVVATPQGAPAGAGCRMVKEQVYQDGRLVQERTREVCP